MKLLFSLILCLCSSTLQSLSLQQDQARCLESNLTISDDLMVVKNPVISESVPNITKNIDQVLDVKSLRSMNALLNQKLINDKLKKLVDDLLRELDLPNYHVENPATKYGYWADWQYKMTQCSHVYKILSGSVVYVTEVSSTPYKDSLLNGRYFIANVTEWVENIGDCHLNRHRIMLK